MRSNKKAKEQLENLFAKLMATEEGRWIDITRTMGGNARGQLWLVNQIIKMAQLTDMQISYTDDTEYKVMRGVPPDKRLSFAQRFGFKPLPKILHIDSTARVGINHFALPTGLDKTITGRMITEIRYDEVFFKKPSEE